MVSNTSPNTARSSFTEEALACLPSLMSVALRLTRHQAESEDLVQDTFMKAVRAERSFAAGTNMKAWLLKILTNTFINRYRRGHLERTIIDGPEAGPLSVGWMSTASLAASGDAEARVLEPMVREEIKRALDGLPEEFRLVVVLCDVEELSYKEVSEIIGRPIGTVMSRLHRGRRLLKAQLTEHARALGIIKDVPEVQRGADDTPIDITSYRARRTKLA